MKILKLTLIIMSLSMGSAFAKCEITLDKSLAGDNAGPISICTEAGKAVLENLIDIPEKKADEIKTTVATCKCDIDGIEIKESNNNSGNHCSSSRSIEILGEEGKRTLKVNSSVVSPE